MSRHFLFILIAALLLSQTGCSSGGDGGSTPAAGNSPTNGSKGGCFTSISSVGGSNIAISGKIEYEDREYGLTGFTNNTTNYYKASRYAEVEIINSATSGAVASAFTNSSGIYRISSSGFTNVTSAYLRVISNTTANTTGKPEIEIDDLSGNLYAVSCDSAFAPQPGTSVTTNLSIPTSNQAAGAFNLMDAFTSGGEFIYSLAATDPPLLKAYWETGNTDGTWYCSSYDSTYCKLGEGIYVLSDTVGGDTDEYDDDVLWHEYGHFVAAKFSKDDSQGGIHYLNDHTLDLRLAWSEGWGDFFPTAVKTWLNSTNTALLSTASGVSASYYIDTSDTTGWSFDIGNNSGDPYIYSSNEVAVANILWRIMNETTSKMSGIWDVFYNYIRTATSPINLETFWDGWLARQSSNGSLASIFSNRAVFYQQDSYETDNTPSSSRTAVLSTGETHYIYNSGDADFVAFDVTSADISSAKSFIIQTYDLKNGADTYLTLFDTNGVSVLSYNDNQNSGLYPNCDLVGCPSNDTLSLSSKITFTPSAAGTYYVKVNASSSRPASAGRYGTYTLKITSQ